MSPAPAEAEPHEPEADGDELTLLLEEALERHEAGNVDMLDLVERAGERGGELREQLRLLLDLDVLSGELREDPPPEFAPLESLGRFRDLRPLAAGGHGRVYEAHDPKLEREVALKVLDRVGLVRDAAAWMLAESRALAKIEHPSVVRVYEADIDDDTAYVVMELIRGPSLADVLPLLGPEAEDARRDAPVELATVARGLDSMAARLRLVVHLARALHTCHSGGVVHRDVKPANVLISPEGPKLIDFGLSHLEDEESSLGLTGRLVGTAGYVAPEQVDSDEVGADPRCDQFALGVVLYELLTHEHPFLRETRHRTMDAISEARPKHPRRVAPEVSPDVALVCLHCLERDPADRYPSLAALADDLEAILDYRAISLRAPSPWRQAQLWLSRHRKQVLLTAGTVAVACGTVFAAWLNFAYVERKAARTELAKLLDRVPLQGTQGPHDFEAHLAGVLRIKERVRALDGEALPRLFLGSLEPRYAELVKLTSTRLATHVRKQRERAGIDDRKVNELLNQWQRADLLNDLANDRGLQGRAVFDDQLGLTADGQLHRYEPRMKPLTQLDAVPYGASLMPGRYRFRGTRDGQPVETEFSAHWWGALVGEARPLDEGFAARMVTCDATEIGWAHWSVPSGVVQVQPFRILNECVTWSELREGLGEARVTELYETYKVTPPPDAELDEQAEVPLAIARAFATAVGARLPTIVELVVAYRAGLLRPGSLLFEFTAVPDVDLQSSLALRLSILDESGFPAAEVERTRSWHHPIPESGINPDATFRIAVSVGGGVPGLAEGLRPSRPKR